MAKNLTVCFLAIVLMFSAKAQTTQTNLLTGNISSFNIQGRTNVQMFMQITWPLNRTIGNKFISNDPIFANSDTNGDFAFTNVQWGKYILRPKDSTGAFWLPTVDTNTLGTMPLASICKPSNAFPPNPSTNYLTAAQIYALVYGISSGAGFATNIDNAYGTNVNLSGNFSGLGAGLTDVPHIVGPLTTVQLYAPIDVYDGSGSDPTLMLFDDATKRMFPVSRSDGVSLNLGDLNLTTTGTIHTYGNITGNDLNVGGSIYVDGTFNGNASGAYNIPYSAIADPPTIPTTNGFVTQAEITSAANALGRTTAAGMTNAANAFTGTFVGTGSSLSNLNASQLTSGTVALARLPAEVVTSNSQAVLNSATIGGHLYIDDYGDLLVQSKNGLKYRAFNGSSFTDYSGRSNNNWIYQGGDGLIVFNGWFTASIYNTWQRGSYGVPISISIPYPGGTASTLQDLPSPFTTAAAMPTPVVTVTLWAGSPGDTFDGHNTNWVQVSNCCVQLRDSGLIAAVTNSGGSVILHFDDNVMHNFLNHSRDANGLVSVNTNYFPTNTMSLVSAYGLNPQLTFYWWNYPTNYQGIDFGGARFGTNAAPATGPNFIKGDIGMLYSLGAKGVRISDRAFGSTAAENVMSTLMTASAIQTPVNPLDGQWQGIPWGVQFTNYERPLYHEQLYNRFAEMPEIAKTIVNNPGIDSPDYYFPGYIAGLSRGDIRNSMNFWRYHYRYNRQYFGLGRFWNCYSGTSAGDFSLQTDRSFFGLAAVANQSFQFGVYSQTNFSQWQSNALACLTNQLFLTVWLGDKAFSPAYQVYDYQPYGKTNWSTSVWAKDFFGSGRVLYVVNEAGYSTNVVINFKDLHTTADTFDVIDVWGGTTNTYANSITVSLSATNSALLWFTNPRKLEASNYKTNVVVVIPLSRISNGNAPHSANAESLNFNGVTSFGYGYRVTSGNGNNWTIFGAANEFSPYTNYLVTFTVFSTNSFVNTFGVSDNANALPGMDYSGPVTTTNITTAAGNSITNVSVRFSLPPNYTNSLSVFQVGQYYLNNAGGNYWIIGAKIEAY